MIDKNYLIQLISRVSDAGFDGISHVGLANYHEREQEAKASLSKISNDVLFEVEQMFEVDTEPRPKKIYTITTIRIDGYRTRTPGWFPTLQEAIETVENNELDIFENYYHFAVVEAVPPGLYAFGEKGREEFWFRWNAEKEGYIQVPKPEKFLRTIGFGIG